MDETSLPSAGHAGDLTSSAHLEIRLVVVGAGEVVPVSGAHPQATPGPGRPEQSPPTATGSAGDLTPAAHLKIATFGPTRIEAGVPAGQTPTLLMSMTGMTGIAGAVVTAWVGAVHVPAHYLGGFLGLAVAELALAFVVILRITRCERGAQDHEAPSLPAPVPPVPESPPPGNDEINS